MEKLFLGRARKDITPKVGGLLFGYDLDTFSTSVNDNLTATAFLFKYGDEKILFLNATVCLIGVTWCNEIRREISQSLNIPFEKIIITTIHTHSGPSLAEEDDGWFFDREYYDEIFHPTILELAREATELLVPVTVGRASGNCYAGVSRRELSLESNTVILGQNPWAPFNPEMNVVSFKSENDGKVLANIITYSAHATAAGRNREVTRDWPGVMIDAIEEISGGLTVFFNGTMGDSGPRLKSGETTGTGIESVMEIGNIAASDAVRIYNSIKTYKNVSIASAFGDLELPLRPLVPYNEAVEMLEKIKSDTSEVHLNGQAIAFYSKVIKMHEDGCEVSKVKKIPQTVVRIGDIAFASFPFEMFTEVVARINKEVSDLTVVAMSYSNGQMLYVPTEDQMCRGGHEVRCFTYSNVPQYATNCDYYLVLGTLQNIKRLKR